MRYSEIVEAICEGHKQEFLRQIALPDNNVSYDYHDFNRPRLTLRMLHKLRIQKDKNEQERIEHLAFLPIMYADPADSETKKKKKKKSKTRNDKIETHAMKLAMQTIKDRDKREQATAKSALSSIKARQ